MGGPTAAAQLARFATELQFSDLPPEVVERAKELILDTLGVSLAAWRLPSSQAMVSVVRAMGGKPEGTVLGSGFAAPACNAALANGTMAHGLDYDDTQLPAQAHMSGSIVPSALAGAEAAAADGERMLAAAIAGWEVGLRVGMAAPGRFNDAGYHATAICGAFGATATFGSLFRVDARQLANAFGIGGSQAAGIMAFLDDPSWVKQMHPGWAGHSGCMAAMLAREGFTGPSTVFEGRFGLYATHIPSKEFDPTVLTGGLGSQWEMMRISMKPYPSGHFNHAFMDAVLYLRQQHSIDPAQVESIHCKVTERAIETVCEPLDEKRRPRDGYATKFSLPYSVAVALATGRAGLREFSDAMAHDPAVLDLAAKVTYSVDPESDFPAHYPGWVIVTMRDGTVYERREPIQRGALERPLSRSEVIAKFEDCVDGVLDKDRASSVVEMVLNLEQQAEVSSLLRLCSARAVAPSEAARATE